MKLLRFTCNLTGTVSTAVHQSGRKIGTWLQGRTGKWAGGYEDKLHKPVAASFAMPFPEPVAHCGVGSLVIKNVSAQGILFLLTR